MNRTELFLLCLHSCRETLSESTFDDIHLAVGRLVSFVNGNDVIIKSAALPLPKERILQMHNKIIPSLSSSCLLCITVSKIQSLKQEKRSLCIRLAESLLSSLGARETQVLDAKLKCSFYSHFIRMSLNLIERSSALMNIVCFSALKCADKILGSFFEVVFTAVKSTEADIFSHSEADALLSSLLQFIPIIREGFSTRGSVSLTATIMMAALEMIPIFHQKTTKFPGLISLSVEFLAAFSSKSITTLGGGQREVYKKALMEFSLSLVRYCKFYTLELWLF